MKGIIFLFIGVIPFIFSSYSFSAYPGDGTCLPVSHKYYTKYYTANNYRYLKVNRNDSTGGYSTGTSRPLGAGYWTVSFRTYYFEGGIWKAGLAFSQSYATENPETFDNVVLSIPDSSVCPQPSPPPCNDSERLCEQLRLVDSNNIIKYASYVTYENRNASMGSTSSLEYRADDFDENLDYTAYLPIGINPDTDCFCPDDDHLPQDLQNNFSVIPPGETIADSAASDPFFCAQQCFPKGYIYTDGKCICVDDSAKTNSATTPPGSPTSETAANAPADPTDSAQQLGAVNENLGSIINQGNQSNEYLSNIADNLATSTNNQQGIVDGLGGLGDQLGNDISGLGDKLDSIQDQQSQGYNLEGSAELPTDNTYDSVVDDVEEDSLSDAITQYLASGIPILSYINGSGATIANASSSMDVVLWGSTVTFDLSPMGSILNTMGYFLTAISMIVAFFIIVGRG